ncbi:1-phosphatidylinositol 4,5-bisphosphate phosphodiesterase eta-2-like [Pantherophis guttatus]|uniref:1-phosphatidylinositol 4,5-bisphosphate phosphodiesterase eta-2-like n=1 Tax=Pantherophis guttatus TaxID=94885 RepID=A0ABM3ZP94_PANGU|nr:1-phosphatidylinositol 4,5-bisphosphate phosphodiesterase eta-2-like [Pantherophis guttatus]
MDLTHSSLFQSKFSVARLAEAFFWVGGSVAAAPKWKMGRIVEKCMNSMQDGTQMIKLRGSSKGLVRFYYLDEHKSCIRWRPSRKNEKAKISIDSIQEVCEGKQSEIFQRYSDGSFDPNCCFTIYYGDHMESLDLVSSNGEEARMWITGLKYLMAGISDEDSLSKRQRTRDQWLKQTFDEADKNGDGSLSINEVLQLMHKLNVNLPRQKVKQMFKDGECIPRGRKEMAASRDVLSGIGHLSRGKPCLIQVECSRDRAALNAALNRCTVTMVTVSPGSCDPLLQSSDEQNPQGSQIRFTGG